jgi:hypothetical protein
MSFVEIVLLAGLVVVLVFAWLRLETLQREMGRQRDRLEQHIQRGHPAPATASTAGAPVTPPQPPPATGPSRGRISRPSLRLVKD